MCTPETFHPHAEACKKFSACSPYLRGRRMCLTCQVGAWVVLDLGCLVIRIPVKPSNMSTFFPSTAEERLSVAKTGMFTHNTSDHWKSDCCIRFPQGFHFSGVLFCLIPNHCPLMVVVQLSLTMHLGHGCFSHDCFLSSPGVMDSLSHYTDFIVCNKQFLFSDFSLK